MFLQRGDGVVRDIPTGSTKSYRPVAGKLLAVLCHLSDFSIFVCDRQIAKPLRMRIRVVCDFMTAIAALPHVSRDTVCLEILADEKKRRLHPETIEKKRKILQSLGDICIVVLASAETMAFE